ncbi:Transcription antitermination factor NusG [Lachnospiraceae bacterium KH1T2]|nr:Transcription antitermination factor NusG [Lachnospiraceae bacterium KH1T2]
MWYVIQVKSGEEQNTKFWLEERLDSKIYRKCVVPVYESVRRRKDKCLIMLRRLFPGYILIDTDEPAVVHDALKKIPQFTSLLGVIEKNNEQKIFIPISKDDEEFLKSILDDGIMHVSYVHLSKAGRIDVVKGPLEKYRKYIVKMEYRHRFATVEADVFGKRRKIDFGLWGDTDPRLPWIEELKSREVTSPYKIEDMWINDTEIHPGDKVEYPEIYGDNVFIVDHIDASRGVIRSKIEMFGCVRNIELYVEDVNKIS